MCTDEPLTRPDQKAYTPISSGSRSQISHWLPPKNSIRLDRGGKRGSKILFITVTIIAITFLCVAGGGRGVCGDQGTTSRRLLGIEFGSSSLGGSEFLCCLRHYNCPAPRFLEKAQSTNYHVKLTENHHTQETCWTLLHRSSPGDDPEASSCILIYLFMLHRMYRVDPQSLVHSQWEHHNGAVPQTLKNKTGSLCSLELDLGNRQAGTELWARRLRPPAALLAQTQEGLSAFPDYKNV